MRRHLFFTENQRSHVDAFGNRHNELTSVIFNSNGEIATFTTGYVMDKSIGNTEGLGAAYGIFYALGYGLPVVDLVPF